MTGSYRLGPQMNMQRVRNCMASQIDVFDVPCYYPAVFLLAIFRRGWQEHQKEPAMPPVGASVSIAKG